MKFLEGNGERAWAIGSGGLLDNWCKCNLWNGWNNWQEMGLKVFDRIVRMRKESLSWLKAVATSFDGGKLVRKAKEMKAFGWNIFQQNWLVHLGMVVIHRRPLNVNYCVRDQKKKLKKFSSRDSWWVAYKGKLHFPFKLQIEFDFSYLNSKRLWL